MHQCTHCQADLPDNAPICSSCGMPVEEKSTTSAASDETEISEEDLETTSKRQAVTVPVSAAKQSAQLVNSQSSIKTVQVGSPLPDTPTQSKKGEADADISPDRQATVSPELPDAEITTSRMADASPQAGEAAAIDTFAEDATSQPIPVDREMPEPPAAPQPQVEEQTLVSPATPLPSVEAQQAALPATPLPQQPSVSSSPNTGRGKNRVLIVAIVVVLLVLAGGAGAFALAGQHTPTGGVTHCSATQQTNCTGTPAVNTQGKATHLSFSGAVTGPMSIVAKTTCQTASAGDLRTLTINLSGTVKDQLYNFGFALEHYNGPGTYNSSTSSSVTILFDVPGETTTNGWGNTGPTDSGSITIDPGAQTGNITYALSGVGSQAKTQVQITGNWVCGN